MAADDTERTQVHPNGNPSVRGDSSVEPIHREERPEKPKVATDEPIDVSSGSDEELDSDSQHGRSRTASPDTKHPLEEAADQLHHSEADGVGIRRRRGSTRGPNYASLEADVDSLHVRTVTLDQIIAIRHQLRSHQTDSHERQSLLKRLDELSRRYDFYSTAFVLDRYFCRYIPAGVALKLVRKGGFRRGRYKDEIDLSYLPEAARTTDPELESAVWHCKSIYLQALRCRANRRSYLIRSIYAVFVYLLSLADSEAMAEYDRTRTQHALPKVQQEISNVEDMLDQSNTMEARHDYLLGMLIGVSGLVGVFYTAFYLLGLLKTPPDAILLGVAIAGSIGAIVSVMTRLTSGKLSVDSRAGPVLIRLAGGFRPIIGAIFGLALYIFIAANLLPIAVTVKGLQLTYFHLGVAFISGFSERLAQDAITRASSVIPATEGPEKPPSTPSAAAKRMAS
jgi:hypothetical protein